jgi:predicted O-methyltransferase YrrM
MHMNFRRVGRQVLNATSLAREPLFSPPGHFYSPISSRADADRARQQRDDLALNEGFDLREDRQLEVAARIAPKWSEFSTTWNRFAPNPMYGESDGAVYYSMLATLRPKNVVEVGSGFSSAIALDIRDRELADLNLTFIEPYPERLLNLLADGDSATTALHRNAVQDVPIEVFDSLGTDDILFIDSTHVSKPGSDVNWLLFRVLPRLRPGVIIHVHDIFYPFEYRESWLQERRSWNEAYLLRAFLSFNTAFQIEFFNSWLWQEHPEVVQKFLPTQEHEQPGSIWLRRVA